MISNAIKFTLKGQIVIRASVNDNQTFKITVEDTGIGIKPEIIEMLGEPFRTYNDGGLNS